MRGGANAAAPQVSASSAPRVVVVVTYSRASTSSCEVATS
jgi:hypothetical protein